MKLDRRSLLATALVTACTVLVAACGGGEITGTGSTSDATLLSITVTPASATLAAGTAAQLAATGSYSNGTSTNVTGLVTWTSSASSVASVSAAGTVSGITPGSATVTATAGMVSGSNTVTVLTSIQMGGAMQGKALSLAGNVSTLAGRAPYGSADGTGGAASFHSPICSATDGTNLYIADTLNHTIRKIVIATGAVTTLAGTAASSGSADGTGSAARFYHPGCVATDGTNVYVADSWNSTIRQIVIATGVVTTLAGSPGVVGNADGTGSAATFNSPYGLTVSGGNLYISDTYNHTVRQLVIATGAVTTLAGSASSFNFNDGTGSAASFGWPGGITTDGTNLYLVDFNYSNVRQIVISTAVVTTLAGAAGASGYADGTGTAATFHLPNGITTDGTNVYVADTTNDEIRKIVISTAAVTTIAGTALVAGSADGTGTAARFYNPMGITTDGTNLYVVDTGNNTVRQFVIATASVTTLAGTAAKPGSVDATGTAARFNSPTGVTTDGTNLYVADMANNTVRQVVIATGAVTTLAGSAGVAGTSDGTGTSARFSQLAAVTTDGVNLYVADTGNCTIRKIVISTAVVTTLAGTPFSCGSADGTGAAAQFFFPMGITTDGTNLYVSDTRNNTIRQIVIATGVVTTLAGTAGTAGSVNGTGSAALFKSPSGLTTDGANLYIADSGNNTIRKLVISTKAVTTVAGSPGVAGSADGAGAAATFSGPNTVTTEGANLYVTDGTNDTVRKIVISTGAVTTIAGLATVAGELDGTGSAARFSAPFGITTDDTSLFVVDTANNTVRQIQ